MASCCDHGGSGGAKTGEVQARKSVGSFDSADGLSPKPRAGSIDIRRFMPENINVEISRTYNLDSKEIGAGGFGKVVIGTDKVMPSRRVAIKKVMIPSNEADKVTALRHEAHIMKELDHPNICKLFEYYENGRFFWFVMELLSGGELFDRIMEEEYVTESLTASIVQQAGSALCFAHRLDIAHRDMKPENLVFVDDDRDKNEIKVIDWGLSFHFGTGRMQSMVGSLTYAAPEVLEARRSYTEACDIWSLGVIAYVMLCGKPPFWGNQSDMVRAMNEERFPLEDEEWSQISNNAKDFIRKSLRSDPEKRMSSADAMLHPWIQESLRNQQMQLGEGSMKQVLVNLKQFTSKSQFYTVAIANVARNLDSHSIGEVHKVFKALDTNQDGLLSLEEMRSGFEKIYGADSVEAGKIEELFTTLDLDGSGTIDYTEFVAAGMGERIVQKEEVLWAAFRQFDPNGDGKLQREEICQALHQGSLSKAWGGEVCSQVIQQVMDEYDKNKDGSIDFEEFTRLMRESAAGNVQLEIGLSPSKEVSGKLADAELRGSARDAQDAVQKALLDGATPGGCCSRPHSPAFGMNNSRKASEVSCLAGCRAKCTVQ